MKQTRENESAGILPKEQDIFALFSN